MKRNRALALVAAATALAAPMAHATGPLDDFVTTATAGVTSAQTASLAVLGGIATMVVVVWGVRRILRFFGR